jgi:hypothetical protein
MAADRIHSFARDRANERIEAAGSLSINRKKTRRSLLAHCDSPPLAGQRGGEYLPGPGVLARSEKEEGEFLTDE